MQSAPRAAESFRDLVLRHRGRTDLTQRQLAARVGVSRGALQDWEAGVSYPDAHHLQALIVAFVEADGFMSGYESAEAEALWAAVLREAPRMQTPFDAAWWAAVLTRHAGSAEGEAVPGRAAAVARDVGSAATQRRVDWGEAPDVHDFVGREAELDWLQRGVVQDGWRLVVVLGMGGIGKTMLAARVAQDVARHFERVYWRSLRNAPPFEEWLAGALGFLSDQRLVLPSSEAAWSATLLQLLRERRCLVVIDNLETLLEAGRQEGGYRQGYSAYGTLLQTIGEGRHQSCLLVTSREAPPEIVTAGGRQTVRTMELRGLGIAEAQTLLADKELSGAELDWATLVARFGGNGLALKVVAERIHQVFAGDIGAFFGQPAAGAVFGGIKRLLDEQVARSSRLEQDVLTRLAIEREPVTVARLLGELGPHVGRGAALEATEALRRRSLVERTQPGAAFTLQSVVLEYVTERLVGRVADEIADGQPDQLVRHPLVKATAKDYLRRAQEQLIAEPILQQLARVEQPGKVERLLLDLLDTWRSRDPAEQGFGPGNAINLLRLLREDLRGVDLSGLLIHQAYLQEVDAQDASLSGAHIAESVLGGAFDAVNCVALSADGAIVAAGTLGGDVRVWRMSDRMPLLSVHGHSGSVGGIALSSDGELLITGGFDGTVRLWAAQTGRSLASLRGHNGGVFDVALGGDGHTLASCGEDGAVRLWDADGVPLASLVGHRGGVYSVALNADGQTIASGGIDGTLRLWDATGRRQPTILEADHGGVVRVALSADGRTVAGCDLQGTVQLWDVQSGQSLLKLRGHTGGVYSVALSADGRMVASAGFDGTARVWDADAGQPLAMLRGHTGAVMSVALTADGDTVASGGLDGAVRVWELTDGRALATLQGYSRGIWGVALSADERTLASGSFDGSVRLWDADDGRLLASMRGHIGGVYGVALSADGRMVASGGNDGTVRLWDAKCHRQLAVLSGHDGGVIDVAVSGDGRMVASGANDGVVRLWDTRTEQLLATLPMTGAVYAVTLTRDGRLLATGGVDGAVRLWAAPSAQPLAVMSGHIGAVYGVALCAEGRTMASCGFDCTVRLWEVPNRRALAILEGHTGAVYSVAISADGRAVASCGFDGTVRLWEAPSGRLLATLEGHSGAVRGMAFGTGGRTVASASLDGTVKLWDTGSFSLLRTLSPDRRFERMDITGLTGATEAQWTALLAIGAIARGSTPANP